MPLQSVYDAVGASDLRIDRASTVSVYQSGPTKIMSVVVRVTGSEAISTDTLENVPVRPATLRPRVSAA